MQRSVLAGSLALVTAIGTWSADGQVKRPLLDGTQAMLEADVALEAKYGRADSAIDGPYFDPSANEWKMVIERGASTDLHRYLITVSESSGEVCVREFPAVDCTAKGDATAALQAVRDKQQGLIDAARNPPPDLQGVMRAVIRDQMRSGRYAASNPMPLYVQISTPGGDGAIDLSPESIRALASLGLQLHPGSAWEPPSEGVRVGATMNLSVGIPTRRPDGDYEVTFGFLCGSVCASQYTAVLRYDASGWRVLSSQMNSIS